MAAIIIPGQSGTYRHLHRRVTGLLVESGQRRAEAFMLAWMTRHLVGESTPELGHLRPDAALWRSKRQREYSICAEAHDNPSCKLITFRNRQILAPMMTGRGTLLASLSQEMSAAAAISALAARLVALALARVRLDPRQGGSGTRPGVKA